MTSHELAKELLSRPDRPIFAADSEQPDCITEVIGVEVSTYGATGMLTAEETKIFIIQTND